MNTPYKHIYKVLRLNRFIVLSVIIIAFSSSVISLFQVRNIQQEFLDKAFVVSSEGTVVPISLAESRANLAVEAQSHLNIFYHNFYELNTSNYETNLEKALWLGNQSIDELYRQKKSEGIYNRLIQYSLVQRVTQIRSEIDFDQDPIAFSSTIEFDVQRGNNTDHYLLKTSGNLLQVDRQFPKNPHGLLITNFFENSLRKLDHENR